MPANPIRVPMQEFTDRYLERARAFMAEVKRLQAQGVPVKRAVDMAWKTVRYDELIKDAMTESMIKSAAIGGGPNVTIGTKYEPLAPKTILDKWVTMEGPHLSSALYANANKAKRIITAELQTQLKLGRSAKYAAQFLQSETGVIKADAPKYLDELFRAAKKAAAGDQDALVDLTAQIKDVRRQISKLSAAGNTDRLKVNYQKLVDAVDNLNFKGMEKRIERAIFEKARYQAERVARTEIARAYGDARMAEIQADEFATGWRSILSNAHRVYDICDFHATANLHGMGPGVYPVGQGPEYPYHPHCLLGDNRIVFDGRLVFAYKSFYRGLIKEIRLTSGKKLTVTINHPILTPDGWVAADKITQGCYVIGGPFSERPRNSIMSWIPRLKPDNDKRPPMIKDVFRALEKSGSVTTAHMPSSIEYFHGDGKFINGNIDIIETNGLLLRDIKTLISKHISKGVFGLRYISRLPLFNSFRVTKFMRYGFLGTANSIMGGFRAFLRKARIKFILGNRRGFYGAPIDPGFYEPSSDNLSTNPKAVGDALLGLKGKIATDYVVDVRTINFSGHVYDLQIEPSQIYICNGVIVKNCTCIIRPFRKDIQGTKRIDTDAAIAHLESLSEEKRVSLMGVGGADMFAENPDAWRSAMGYAPEVKKDPQLNVD